MNEKGFCFQFYTGITEAAGSAYQKQETSLSVEMVIALPSMKIKNEERFASIKVKHK